MNRKRRVKAVINCLWLMLICLTLTACSSEGGTQGQTDVKQEGEKPEYLGLDQNEFQQRMDLSTIAVNVKSGIEFTLYVDPMGTIQAVHCHDEGARNVCSSTPLIDLELESGLFAVFDHMVLNGFMADGARVEIRITEEEGIGPEFPLYDVIDRAFHQVRDGANLNVGMSVNSSMGNVGAVIREENTEGDSQMPEQEEQVPDQNGQVPEQEQQVGDRDDQTPTHGDQSPDDSRYLEAQRDENGKLIWTLESDGGEGLIERYYDSMEQCTREEIQFADGLRVVTEFQEGVPVYVRHIRPNGNITEEVLRSDGTVERLIEYLADGTKCTVTFRVNGQPDVETIEYGDDSIRESTYSEQGKPLYQISRQVDGTYNEINWEYDGAHNLIGRTDKNSDGTVAEIQFGKNEVMISEVRRLPDGEIIEITFTEDGKERSRTRQMPDGTFIQEEWEYNSAGILIRQFEQGSNGFTSESIYDGRGMLISKIETNPGGSRVELDYYPNGNRKTCTTKWEDGRSETWQYTEDGTSGTMTNQAGTYTETYYPNGRVAVVCLNADPLAGFDFTYEESTFDENGTRLTHTKILNSGVVAASTYHYDNSHTTVFTYPGGGGHTEYWYGNNCLGGIDSNGNPWGVTVPGADYSELNYSGGTIGKG